MKTLRWVALATLVVPALAAAQEPKVEKLSNHAYAYVAGQDRYNSGFVVTDDGVFVIDTQDTVVHAEEFIAEIRKISTKPILYAVNTNFHVVNVTGNQLLVKEVKAILAHEATRKDIVDRGQEELGNSKQMYALQIEQFEKSLRDDPLTDQERAATDARLADAKKSLTGLDRTVLTPPNWTVTPEAIHFYPDGPLKHDLVVQPGGEKLQTATMSFKIGGVDIQVLFLGRGYTDGDLLVYVPSEKVLYAGGLLFAQTIPWLRGAHVSEWQATLEKVLKLDIEKVVPIRGEMATKDDLIAFKGYLTDLYTAVKNQWDQGVAKDDVRWKVDLSAYQNWASFDMLRYNIEDVYDELEATRKAGGN
jgi:cyclase